MKPPLPEGVIPTIWAEVVFNSYLRFVIYSPCLSRDRPFANLSRGSALIKVAYILRREWWKVICWVHSRPRECAFPSIQIVDWLLKRRDVYRHNGKLIISHGYDSTHLTPFCIWNDDASPSGGSSQIVRQKGNQTTFIVADDQAHNDKSVRALLHNYETKLPIVLIADDKYQLFPYGLGKYVYVVLGYYWIVDAWGASFLHHRTTLYISCQQFSGEGDLWQWSRILCEI